MYYFRDIYGASRFSYYGYQSLAVLGEGCRGVLGRKVQDAFSSARKAGAALWVQARE